MKKIILPGRWKSVLIGGLTGVVVFFVLVAVRAQSTLTVSDFHANSKTYVGSLVSVSGLARNIRSETKKRNGVDVPFTTLNLYEVDSKGKQRSYYIYVSLPSSAFSASPADGVMATITGNIKWPYMIGAIDQ
jgi:hypothetical protein